MRQVIADLASKGCLRAAVSLSNLLLVSGRTEQGAPAGIAPDLAAAMAEKLGVPVELVPFARPAEIADSVNDDRWDISFIAIEAKRADSIHFSPAIVAIDATYLLPRGRPETDIASVDHAGTRICVSSGSAYEKFLSRHMTQASIVHARDFEASVDLLRQGGGDVLAGLRPLLLEAQASFPDARVLEGSFTSIQQAIGMAKGKPDAAAFIAGFLEEARASGLVAQLIAAYGVRGLTV